MKPTFIGIGAQKCASTWLYRILEDHPDIGVSAVKEINFFSCYYDFGYQWYERVFSKCVGKKTVGEISPSYFSDPSAPKRVHDYIPSAKILVSLRDPVHRALSQHRHEIRLGHFAGDDLSFEAGLKNNPTYIEQGLYATHLKRWLAYFSAKQVHVVLTQEINKNPLSVAQDVYEFLGVDASHEPDCLSKLYNPSYANRYRKLVNMKDWLYKATRMPVLNGIWRMGHALGLRALYRRINTMSSDAVIPEVHSRTIAYMRQLYTHEIQELSGIVGKPLDDWL